MPNRRYKSKQIVWKIEKLYILKLGKYIGGSKYGEERKNERKFKNS